MKNIYVVMLVLASILVFTCSCRRATPPQTAAKPKAQADAHQPPVTYADFSRFDLSSPQKATVSFVELFNGILPASPQTDLEKICSEATTMTFQPDCLKLLDSRLQFLKGIARNLKGARFSYQPLGKMGAQPPQFTAIWKERFSFFDGTEQTNDKQMTITLQQEGGKWKIAQVVE